MRIIRSRNSFSRKPGFCLFVFCSLQPSYKAGTTPLQLSAWRCNFSPLGFRASSERPQGCCSIKCADGDGSLGRKQAGKLSGTFTRRSGAFPKTQTASSRFVAPAPNDIIRRPLNLAKMQAAFTRRAIAAHLPEAAAAAASALLIPTRCCTGTFTLQGRFPDSEKDFAFGCHP